MKNNSNRNKIYPIIHGKPAQSEQTLLTKSQTCMPIIFFFYPQTPKYTCNQKPNHEETKVSKWKMKLQFKKMFYNFTYNTFHSCFVGIVFFFFFKCENHNPKVKLGLKMMTHDNDQPFRFEGWCLHANWVVTYFIL